MFKRKNILKHSSYTDAYPNIVPARNIIPDWYKKNQRFESGAIPKNAGEKAGFKLCKPFGESLMSGYILPLPMDIIVEQTEGGPSISWRNDGSPAVSLRDDKDINGRLPAPSGYSDLHFVWHTQNAIKLPSGYSALFTHPLNRYDLPFITLSGIVDGHFVMPRGQVPVFFNKTFEGLIPAGTPIMQIILFKTENWLSKVDKNILTQADTNSSKSVNKIFGWYQENAWKKKTYQ